AHAVDVVLPVVSVVALIALICNVVLEQWAAFAGPVWAAVMIAWDVSILGYAGHAEQQCPKCQSRFPVDEGPDTAARLERRLRIYHWYYEGPIWLFTMVGAPLGWLAERCGIGATGAFRVRQIGGMLVTMGAIIWLTWTLSQMLPSALALAVAMPLGLLLLLTKVTRPHNMLRQWCRWCHRDDGGEREPYPAPGKTVSG